MIRVDSVGALVAVGSSSGLIRVFDFDEFMLYEKNRSQTLLPSASTSSTSSTTREGLTGGSRAAIELSAVLVLDTRRDIADLQWSNDPSRPDLIFVSFRFNPEIYVYDIEDTDSVQAGVDTWGSGIGASGLLKMKLVTGKDGLSSSMAGHLCLCPLNNGRIIAGSSAGPKIATVLLLDQAGRSGH